MENNKKKGIIKYIIIIAVILAVVFLSQQVYLSNIGKNLYSQGNKYWTEADQWLKTNIYPMIGKEVENRGEEAKEEIAKQKDNALKSLWEKIKNFLAQKFSKFSGTKVE